MTKINLRPKGAIFAFGIIGLMLSMSSPVMAEDNTDSSKITIRTHDLDLSSPAGIERLQQRVNSAIRAACAPVEFGAPTAYGLGYMTSAQSDCLADAHAAVAPKVQRLIANGNTKVAAY
jgi:UrcA family protein